VSRRGRQRGPRQPGGGKQDFCWLIWDKQVAVEDVAPAFQKLTAILDKAEMPVHVLVDLRSDPAIPLSATTTEVLGGPFRHKMMGEWLVIGKNWRAEMIANVITKVGLRMNISWFETADEALARLREIAVI
jgi:hypothetical protein